MDTIIEHAQDYDDTKGLALWLAYDVELTPWQDLLSRASKSDHYQGSCSTTAIKGRIDDARDYMSTIDTTARGN